MARKVEVRLIDDLDQGPADESVEFALDGADYTIDLSAKNAAKLRLILGHFVEHATRVRPTAAVRRTPRQRPRTPQGDPLNQAIRGWAAERGIAVAVPGRIRQNVVDQYHAEKAQPEPTATPRQRRRTRRHQASAA